MQATADFSINFDSIRHQLHLETIKVGTEPEAVSWDF